MDGLEPLLTYGVPPLVASLATVALLWLRWRKQRSGERTTEWDRLTQLLDRLTKDLDRCRTLNEKRERELARYLRRFGPLPDDELTDTHDLDAIRRRADGLKPRDGGAPS